MILHIEHTHPDRHGRAWCDAHLRDSDWAFSGLDHAAACLAQGTREQPCPHCLQAARKALEGK